MLSGFEVFTAVCRGHANHGRSWEIHQLWNIFEATSYWDPGPAGSLFRGSSCSPGEAQSNSSKWQVEPVKLQMFFWPWTTDWDGRVNTRMNLHELAWTYPESFINIGQSSSIWMYKSDSDFSQLDDFSRSTPHHIHIQYLQMPIQKIPRHRCLPQGLDLLRTFGVHHPGGPDGWAICSKVTRGPWMACNWVWRLS